MADDIVARLHCVLRHENDPLALTWLAMCAADEIERLRAERDEALDAQRGVETLKAELVRNADEFRETITELRQRIETLTDERDEARQGKTDAR